MFTGMFGGFSVDDIETAKVFYGETLELSVQEQMSGLDVRVGDVSVWIYAKPDHQPASYTTLNLTVENIDTIVDTLAEKGVSFEKYEGLYQDDKGIARGKEIGRGPNIAWLKDPAGNIIALIEE